MDTKNRANKISIKKAPEWESQEHTRRASPPSNPTTRCVHEHMPRSTFSRYNTPYIRGHDFCFFHARSPPPSCELTYTYMRGGPKTGGRPVREREDTHIRRTRKRRTTKKHQQKRWREYIVYVYTRTIRETATVPSPKVTAHVPKSR